MGGGPSPKSVNPAELWAQGTGSCPLLGWSFYFSGLVSPEFWSSCRTFKLLLLSMEKHDHHQNRWKELKDLLPIFCPPGGSSQLFLSLLSC